MEIIKEWLDWIYALLITVSGILKELLLYIENTLRHSPPLEHFGAITAAITGVLVARYRRIDFFGIFVLGFVTAAGGGTIRDIILDVPVWWIVSPAFTISIGLTCAITFFLVRLIRLPSRLLDIADTFALALFSVIGTAKALDYNTGVISAVMMGVITGVAGGMLRDIMIGSVPRVLRAGVYFYATASICGSIAFVISDYYDLPLKWTLSIALILVLRLGSLKWKLTLPEYHSSDEIPPQNPS